MEKNAMEIYPKKGKRVPIVRRVVIYKYILE